MTYECIVFFFLIGESIPIRLFLSPYELTPTHRNINNKFSVKYYLNLVLVDEEDRRYFKQQEITIYRLAETTWLPAGCSSLNLNYIRLCPEWRSLSIDKGCSGAVFNGYRSLLQLYIYEWYSWTMLNEIWHVIQLSSLIVFLADDEYWTKHQITCPFRMGLLHFHGC